MERKIHNGMGVGHCNEDSVYPMSNAGGVVETSSHASRAGKGSKAMLATRWWNNYTPKEFQQYHDSLQNFWKVNV